jgi:hypothetical protein
MTQFRRVALVSAGAATAVGALLHVAIAFGGPGWYAFFGAPAGLVALAATDSLRPAISCVIIATILLACSAFAFSGAGVIRRLPGVRAVLALVGVGLVVRGVTFVPIVALRPERLYGFCGKCQEVNSFVIVTSAICLVVGAGYLVGAIRKPDQG